MLLLQPVKRLAGIHNIFEQALGASQRVFEYLDRTEEIAEKPGRDRFSPAFAKASFSTMSRSATPARRADFSFREWTWK